MAEKMGLLGKFKQLLDYKVDGMLSKAKNNDNPFFIKRKSVFTDDTTLTDQGGFQEKTSIIPFEILRQVAERDMVCLSVINKLVNRVAVFSDPQKDRYSFGYKIRLKHKDITIQDEHLAEIKKIEDFFSHTGYVTDGRPKSEIRNFDTFLRLITRDALIYNQIAIEMVPSKKGSDLISYFLPVSGGSIRYAIKDLADKIENLEGLIVDMDNSPEKAEQIKEMTENIEKIKYMQVYKGQILTAYTEEELVFKQWTPTTEISSQGYAQGPLEFLINTIASHRLAEVHNEVFFKQGHANNGILNIKTDMTAEDLEGVRRMLQRQSAGVRNAHRQVVFAAPEGIEWIPMSSMSNKDMEWSDWNMYLIKLICSVFGINPAEINFDISKEAGALGGDSGRRNETILKDSRNSILRPILMWIEDIVNDEIFPRFNPQYAEKYHFEFVGLDSADEDLELDRISKKVKSIYTVNDVRKELGMKELEYGDIILDTVYLQWVQSQTQPQDGGGQDPNAQTAPGTSSSGQEDKQGADQDELSILLDQITGSPTDQAEKALKRYISNLQKSDLFTVRWEK